MAHDLQLPLSVVGPADVMRLRRNLEQFDDQQQQAALRAKAGSDSEDVPAGRILRELATTNKRDLASSADRQSLLGELEILLKSAPTVTMSFATEPSASFMAKIVGWFRNSLHPSLLVRVGLQPNIAAGCVVHVGGKMYDFSLRNKFTEQRAQLIAGIRKAPAAPRAPVSAPQSPTPSTPQSSATATGAAS